MARYDADYAICEDANEQRLDTIFKVREEMGMMVFLRLVRLEENIDLLFWYNKAVLESPSNASFAAHYCTLLRSSRMRFCGE